MNTFKKPAATLNRMEQTLVFEYIATFVGAMMKFSVI